MLQDYLKKSDDVTIIQSYIIILNKNKHNIFLMQIKYIFTFNV